MSDEFTQLLEEDEEEWDEEEQLEEEEDEEEQTQDEGGEMRRRRDRWRSATCQSPVHSNTSTSSTLMRGKLTSGRHHGNSSDTVSH